MKCYQKKAYQSKKEAEKIAKYEMLTSNKTPNLTTYQCPLCKKWHLAKAQF